MGGTSESTDSAFSTPPVAPLAALRSDRSRRLRPVPWLNLPRRIPRQNLSGSAALHHHCSRRTDGFFSQRYPRPDKSPGSNPTTAGDFDGTSDQVKTFTPIIMSSGAEKDSLRNADVRVDPHRGQAKDRDFIADPNMVPHLKPPRKRDIDSRADDDTASDLRSKSPQAGDLYARGNRKPRRKANRAGHPPKSLFPPRSTPLKTSVIKLAEIKHLRFQNSDIAVDSRTIAIENGTLHPHWPESVASLWIYCRWLMRPGKSLRDAAVRITEPRPSKRDK